MTSEPYESLSEKQRSALACVITDDAHCPLPELERPYRAFCLLRDPVKRVSALYRSLRELDPRGEEGAGVAAAREIERREWSLADLYRELGGGGPRSSAHHALFGGFFNGQTRSVLAPWEDETKLEYWAGIPDRGTRFRDTALELLGRHYVVGLRELIRRSQERFAAALGWEPWGASYRPADQPPGRLDPETRALVLAHNQLDAELHAHFRSALERDRRTPNRRNSPSGAAVCVLGMSRSGTSLTARILNLLGVDLGPREELMAPARRNNPAGFWEHEGIADLNEDILATLGDAPRQRWRRPPRLEEGWERDPRLERHRQEARRILRRSFARRPLWGWKDPRTCLTLPFWRDLLPEVAHLESRLRYVICIRHPLDVGDSLRTRDQVGREEGLRLWLRYLSNAIVHTAGRTRTFVSYEGYFPDWERQAAHLAEFLGLPSLSAAQRARIADHIDDGLWHHRRAGHGAEEGTELPPEVAELYALLAARCGRRPDTASEAALDAAARRSARAIAQA